MTKEKHGIHRIAEMANVSIGTVDRALHGRGGIKEATRKRILQIADIYDALTTARPYKPAFTREHAMEIMLEEARRGWRDPELVPLFAEVSEKPPEADAAIWPGNATLQQSLESMRRELSK